MYLVNIQIPLIKSLALPRNLILTSSPALNLGSTAYSLDKTFNLPMNGKFRVVIKEGGPYEIVSKKYICRIAMNGEQKSFVCREVFYKLFFKPDGRKSYDIQVKRIRKDKHA